MWKTCAKSAQKTHNKPTQKWESGVEKGQPSRREYPLCWEQIKTRSHPEVRALLCISLGHSSTLSGRGPLLISCPSFLLPPTKFQIRETRQESTHATQLRHREGLLQDRSFEQSEKKVNRIALGWRKDTTASTTFLSYAPYVGLWEGWALPAPRSLNVFRVRCLSTRKKKQCMWVKKKKKWVAEPSMKLYTIILGYYSKLYI